MIILLTDTLKCNYHNVIPYWNFKMIYVRVIFVKTQFLCDIFDSNIRRDVSNRRNTFEKIPLSILLWAEIIWEKYFWEEIYWAYISKQIFWMYTYKTLKYIKHRYFQMKYYWEETLWAYYKLRTYFWVYIHRALKYFEQKYFEKKYLSILYIVYRYLWVYIYI